MTPASRLCDKIELPVEGLKEKSSENFQSKILTNFDILAGLGGTGYKNFRFLGEEAHPCANPRRLSHFASKLVRASDLQVGSGKRPGSYRKSHKKDMSPFSLWSRSENQNLTSDILRQK